MLTRLKKLATMIFGREIPPVISPNTFIVWEPCTHSHAEVVPGYVQYLLDLGFDVSVFATPERFDEGLFSRFKNNRISLNRLRQRSIRRFFRKNGLLQARGILITTARKISGKDTYQTELELFSGKTAGQKILLVEHDIKATFDNGSLTPQIITLRKAHYKNAITTVINPHYFGNINTTKSKAEIVNFITIGAMRGKRRNTRLLIEAATALHDKGITNFKITVIGRGGLRTVPSHIRKHFDIKGRVDFANLYAELEKADFFLTLLDPDNPQHDRYITTGTSGSFQLIYGFVKPCLIADKFAAINGFNNSNSVVYATNDDLPQAMSEAIAMNPDSYTAMQQALKGQADALYAESLENLRRLIHE